MTDAWEPLHTRNYEVEAFRCSPQEFVLLGSIIDRKPSGFFIDTDPDPFVLHHMVVELRVSYPGLVVVASEVKFNTFPETLCPAIAQSYGDLVGVSIARGFSRVLRESFGGARGCSHTTALLQAMAPVAVQCNHSMATLALRESRRGPEQPAETVDPTATVRRTLRLALNSCHVWDEQGELARSISDGTFTGGPVLPVRARLEELGIDADQWAKEHPGG